MRVTNGDMPNPFDIAEQERDAPVKENPFDIAERGLSNPFDIAEKRFSQFPVSPPHDEEADISAAQTPPVPVLESRVAPLSSAATRMALSPRLGRVAPRGKVIAYVPETKEPSESLLGLKPELIPPGTGPVTSLLSAGGKAAVGAAGYMTSRQGIVEAGVAATPAAPAVFAKWAYDMIQGGIASVKDASSEIAAMIRDAINRQVMTANQLGIPEKATKEEKQAHIQRLAEDAVNAVVGIAGGLGAGAGAVRGVARLATPTPLEFKADAIAPVAPATAEALKQTAQSLQARYQAVHGRAPTAEELRQVEAGQIELPVEEAAKPAAEPVKPETRKEPSAIQPSPEKIFRPVSEPPREGVQQVPVKGPSPEDVERRKETPPPPREEVTRPPGVKPDAKEWLVSAFFKDPATGTKYTAANHPEALRVGGGQPLVDKYATRESRNTADFGFRTNLGNDLTRPEAAKLAKEIGQDLEPFETDAQGREQPHTDEIQGVGPKGTPMGDVPQTPTVTAEQRQKPISAPTLPAAPEGKVKAAGAEAGGPVRENLLAEKERILQDIDDWRSGARATPGQPSSGQNYQLSMREAVKELDKRLAEINKQLVPTPPVVSPEGGKSKPKPWGENTTPQEKEWLGKIRDARRNWKRVGDGPIYPPLESIGITAKQFNQLKRKGLVENRGFGHDITMAGSLEIDPALRESLASIGKPEPTPAAPTPSDVPTVPAAVENVKEPVEQRPTATTESPSKQKSGFDTKQAKEQKKFLLDEIYKAIEEAPEAKKGYQTEELQQDKAFASESFDGGEDYKAWKEKHEVLLQPLFEKYNIPETYPAIVGYKSLDGSITGSRPAGKYDFETREKLLLKAIEDANYALIPKVVIEVPNDGTFTVHNTKGALQAFQEKAKSFPTTAPRVSKPSTPRTTPTSPAQIGTLEKPNIVKAAALSVGDDPTREIIQNIYSDDKQTVSVNGRMLTRISKGIGGTKEKPLLQKPSGEKDTSGGKFPNFNQVIPEKSSLTIVGKDLDTTRLFTIAKQAEQVTTERETAIKLLKNPDGSIGITSSSTDVGDYGHNVQEGAERLVALSPKYFINALNAARLVGDSKVSIEYTDALSPIVIRSKNTESVIMPMRMGDESVPVMKKAGIPVEEIKAGATPEKSVQDVWREQYARQLDKIYTAPGVSGLTHAEEAIRTAQMLEMPKSDLANDLAERGMTQPNIDYALRNYKEPSTPEGLTGPDAVGGEPPAEIRGMGGAVPSEFEQPGSIVSNMFAAIDRDRAAMGKPPMEATQRRTWDQDNTLALTMMNRNPDWIPQLIKEMLYAPRPLLSWENAGLVWHRAKLTAELNNALQRISQSFDGGVEQSLKEAKVDAAVFEDQIEELDRAVGRGGTGSEAGRSLQAQKMGAGDDFTLIEIRLRKRGAVGGRPLTDAESSEVKALHDQIAAQKAEYDKAIAEKDAKLAEQEVKFALDKIALEAKAKPSYSAAVLRHAERFAKFMDKQGNDALARIRARRAEGRMQAGIDPTDLIDLSIYGASKITRGMTDLAVWSAHMIDAVGDWVKPHINEIWKASQDRQDLELAKLEKPLSKVTAEGVKRKVKGVEAADKKDKIISGIKAKFDAKKRGEITNLVQKLARSFVEEGINEREALIDAVHGVLREIDPEFTRREAMDAISGYGDFKQLRKDQISKELRDLKGQMQQVAKLEDMQAGQPPLKTGLERRIPSREESRLIKLVNEAKQKFQVPITDPETQLKSSLDTLKTRMTNRIAELEEKMATGDFTRRPRRETVLDVAATRLKANYERTKKKFNEMLLADRMKNRTTWEKSLDWGTKYRRFGVLSSPVVIPKLISAGVQRLTSLAAEEGIGSVLSRLPGIKGVSERAPVEGGGANLRAEMRGYGAAFGKGMKDAYDVLKTGHSDLDVLYGKAGETYTGESEMASRFLALPGRVHGMIKAPVKRAVFERTVQRLGEYYAKQGLDPADEVLSARIMLDAYKEANKAIFLQDNRLASAVSGFMRRLEQPSKTTGKPTVGGKTMATIGRVALPIVRVPINIVAETMQYAGGLASGSLRLANALRKGVENVTPEQADLIMRELKKGSIGAAVLMIGYFNADVIGGYYQPGKKRKPGDIKPGSIRVLGVDVPSYLLHNPLLETLQIGATVRQVAESHLRKKDVEPQGLTAGAMAAAWGVVEQVPFMREQIEIEKFRNRYQRGRFMGEQAKSVAVPAVIQKAAEWMDRDIYGNPIKRQPTTVPEYIQSGIPILREQLPVKP